MSTIKLFSEGSKDSADKLKGKILDTRIAIDNRKQAVYQLASKSRTKFDVLLKDMIENEQLELQVKEEMVSTFVRTNFSTKIINGYLGKVSPLADKALMPWIPSKGDAETLKKVTGYLNNERVKGGVRKRFENARILLSYKLNQPDALLPKVKASTYETFRGLKNEKFTLKSMKSEEISPFKGEFSSPYFLHKVNEDHGFRVNCQKKKLTFLFNDDVVSKELNLKQNGILGSIMQEEHCPEGQYLKYHLTYTRQGDSNNYSVHALNPKGDIRLSGEASMIGGEFSLDLKSLSAPGVSPISFAGRLSSKYKLSVEDARSAVNRRKRSVIKIG